MSNIYLDKFQSTFSTIQGNQVLKTLTKKKDSGEIKTIDEFKAKLVQLTSKLLAEKITPTLQLLPAVIGKDISSEEYNDMLEKIEHDLSAGFAEANTLDEVIAAHHSLINEVSLKTLRYGLNELEDKISLYEFLKRNNYGFDDTSNNSFRESKNNRTTRASNSSSVIFTDPRLSVYVPNNEDCYIDPIGERLLLGTTNKIYHTISNINWLANANSVRSELDVEVPNSNILNLLDGKKNTYWIVPLLFETIRSSGVLLELEIVLPNNQDANFIEIEPASDSPMELTSVQCVNPNGTTETIISTSIEVKNPITINFDKKNVRSFILRFKQNNYSQIQFIKKTKSSNFYRAVLNENLKSIDMTSIDQTLRNVLTSDFILNDILKLNNISSSEDVVSYYQYIIGFDNIKVGINDFNERGIFLSQKKSIKNLGQIGLMVVEKRPAQLQNSTSIDIIEHSYAAQSTTEDSYLYLSSIEYSAILQFFSKNGYLVATESIPILPIGASRIYHERVLFTYKTAVATNNNVGQLRFYTNATSTDATNLKVILYRNGTQLTYGTDWSFVDPNDSLDPAYALGATYLTPNSGFPMKRAIRVHHEVQLLDIYTISYDPTTSNSIFYENTALVSTVDLSGDNSIRMINDNIIIIDNIKKSYEISNIDIYLSILYRRNTANNNHSPILEEYKMVFGSYNQNKFGGI